MGMTIHSDREIDEMRKACALAAQTLIEVGKRLEPGMTTHDIDVIVHDFTIESGATPATLGYKGFPRSCCTSVNEVVCHGIPTKDLVLKDGDIINVDVTPIYPKTRGYHGDTSATFYVGEPSPMAKHLVEVTRQALEVGLAVVRPGASIGDIGHAIQTFVEAKGCSVVRDYTGHGIGRKFHTEPSVPHYGRPGTGPRLKKGMTFTIEPMVNLGTYEIDHLPDRWTVLTRDRALSAQFEHTVVVTKDGVDVLTARHEVLRHCEDVPWARLGPLGSFIPKPVQASAS